MRHVIIYHEKRLDDIYFEKEYVYESILLKEKPSGIEIHTKVLKENEVYQYAGYSFICLPFENKYSYIHLEDDTYIGRDPSIAVCIDLDWISNVHAHIYWNHGTFVLEDLNSTNGVYYQSHRISSLPLWNGCIFYLVYLKIIYFDSFLLIAYPLSSHPLPSFPTNKWCISSNPKQPPVSISCHNIELESYILDKKCEKQKLFQAIGSSLLILLSSFVSCSIMYFMHPEQKSQLVSMVFMSGSMAISFLCFGLYNREANYQTMRKQNEENRKQYLSYLDTMEKQVEELRFENENKIHKCRLNALEFKGMEKTLLSFEPIVGIHFQIRKWNYQQVNHEMVGIIQNWIEKHSYTFQTPMYVEERTYFLQEDIQWAYGFFEALCINEEKLKVVWMTKSLIEEISYHPLCCVNHQRLWIYDEDSYQKVYPFLLEYPILYIIEDECFPTLDGIKLYLNKEGIKGIPYQFKEVAFRKNLYRRQLENHISLSSILKNKKRKKQVDLEICLGLNTQLQPIYLNLTEGKDGCHGLIAGSTGYGKSELMANLLLQLIHQNDPQYFQYILIDFKGGAFGNAFKRFEHFAGMITNLDEDVNRFIVYITNFIKDRQEKLKAFQSRFPNEVGHIDAYNRMHIDHPMAHVFIIVDEFAQMKTQAIELLNEMKQLARIGRSLGIHLILSTQKPMGVIDDQIWANSSYHICLKVLSKQDSKEVLHTDHAYDLQYPGEFILHSQNEEKKGKSFYIHDLKDANNSYFEVNEKDEIIKDVPKISYLDDVLNEMHSSVQHFIIPPPLKDYSFEEEWCVYEDMEQKELKSIHCEYGQVIVLLTNDIKRVSQSIASFHQKERIYTLNINEIDAYVDACFFDDSLYWKCLENKEKATLILNIDSFELWHTLFNHKTYRMYIVLSQYKNIYTSYIESLTKMCVFCSNLDAMKNFFQNFSCHIQNENGLLKIKNRMYACRLHEGVCVPKKKKKPFTDIVHGLEIGMNAQYQSIYWNQNNPLLICFVQKSMKPKIEKLLTHWQKLKRIQVSTSLTHSFDVCVLDVSKQKEEFLSSVYIQNHYDWDVLWLGKGCQDYAYLLHRKCPIQLLDMVYWHGDHEEVVKWKEF